MSTVAGHWPAAAVWALCAGIGLCSGFLAGLLGVGGSTVIVPALILAASWLGIGADDAARVAMATALAIVIPTSISSAQAHALRGSIDWRAFWKMVPGITAGALTGTLAACALGARLALAAFIGLALLAAMRLLAPDARRPEVSLSGPQPMVPLGPRSVAIGLVSGLAGVGGGLLSVPLLARYIPMRRAIGTAAALGLPVAAAGLTGYLVAGRAPQCVAGCLGCVFIPAVPAISLAAMIAAPVGARLAHRLPVRCLERVFASVLLLVCADFSIELLG